MRTAMLTPEEVLKFWPSLQIEIEKALEHSVGESTSYDIFKKIQSGVAHCWIVLDEEDKLQNVSVTEILQYSQHKTLHIITSSGKGWDAYKYAHHTLEDFARYNECKNVSFWGRKPWERMLQKLEGQNGEKYTTSYVVMHMELGESNEK